MHGCPPILIPLQWLSVYIYIYICKYLSVHIYKYVNMYIYREREVPVGRAISMELFRECGVASGGGLYPFAASGRSAAAAGCCEKT